jgi:hypothetical protein
VEWSKCLIAAIVLLGCVQPCGRASAENLPEALSETDRSRLENFEANRASAITVAQTGENDFLGEELKKYRKTLTAVLAGDSQKIEEADILGKWRCRTLKLGGGLPLVAYGYFRCKIHKKNGQLIFEKTTGSQLTKGRLLRLGGDRFLYAGAAKGVYGENEKENEVGYLFKVGPKRLRLEMPKPHYESEFNIMELAR